MKSAREAERNLKKMEEMWHKEFHRANQAEQDADQARQARRFWENRTLELGRELQKATNNALAVCEIANEIRENGHHIRTCDHINPATGQPGRQDMVTEIQNLIVEIYLDNEKETEEEAAEEDTEAPEDTE